MPGFKFNLFSGLRPRMPESLLPPGGATVAQNCDFAYGELRNTKNGFAIYSWDKAPRSFFTDDGLTFFTWPGDVDAVRSPLANDQFHRMYFTGGDGFRVANRLHAKSGGGEPPESYLVGVPRPTVAPILTALPPPTVDNGNAVITFRFHYEHGGIKYQEGVLVPQQLDAASYQFTPPEKDEETPKTAFPVVRMTALWRSDDSQALDLYSSNSSFAGVASGLYGLEMSKDAGEGVKTYTLTLSTSVKESDKETRAYVYTYVNQYGEEGPPSAPALVTTSPAISVSVNCAKDPAPDFCPIKEIRIYRTPTGSAIAEYFFVGAIRVLGEDGTFIFTDKVRGEMLNEPLSSTDAYPPKHDLTGLMALPNGILCAWRGNELHFSEAYRPWAWPPQYVKTLPTHVVGGIVHGSGAVITTKSHPYLVSGVSPDAMTTSKINVDQAGVSKWSIAVVDGVVMYASNDGLVVLTGASASLAQGQVFFTREVWRERYGAGIATMRFAVWDGRLVVFCSEGQFTSFMIRFDEADGTMTELPEFVARATFVNLQSDQFYYVNDKTIFQFNGGTAMQAVWQSGEHVFPRPLNFGAAQAVTEGDWTMELWACIREQPGGQADYRLMHIEQIREGVHDFRLPSGYEADRYRIRLTGSGRFRELRVAQSFRELAGL